MVCPPAGTLVSSAIPTVLVRADRSESFTETTASAIGSFVSWFFTLILTVLPVCAETTPARDRKTVNKIILKNIDDSENAQWKFPASRFLNRTRAAAKRRSCAIGSMFRRLPNGRSEGLGLRVGVVDGVLPDDRGEDFRLRN